MSDRIQDKDIFQSRVEKTTTLDWRTTSISSPIKLQGRSKSGWYAKKHTALQNVYVDIVCI